MDNWDTTPHLLKYFRENQINACDTARRNITRFPKKLINEQLQQHQTTALKNGSVLAIKYKDTKDVLFLSNFHDKSVIQVKKKGVRNMEVLMMIIHDQNCLRIHTYSNYMEWTKPVKYIIFVFILNLLQ